MSDNPLKRNPVLELDHVFEGLAHPRRRYLLYTLLEKRKWSLDDLANEIAAWETDTAISDLEDEKIERVYISLYHNHVPKLTDDEIITFDEKTETIRPGSTAEQVLPVLNNAGGTTENQLEAHARSQQDTGDS